MQSWLVSRKFEFLENLSLTMDIARAIQQELLDDFANKPELSDWFSRVCERLYTSVKE
jgi:hypothetical protein